LSLRRPRFEIFDFKNAVTLKTGLGVRQGHWKYHYAIERIQIPMALSRVASEIFNKMRGRRSLKVIESDICMHGFLLVFFSNFVPITHQFYDIRIGNI